MAHARTERPQYVLISFDGAHDLRQWERSRSIARQAEARFTYFISCTFLLSPANKGLYQGPGMAAGRSNVGFASSPGEVAERLRHVWLAKGEGHEIASHGCGHFDGKGWNADAWRTEHRAFSQILANAWEINGIPDEPAGWRDFAGNEILGFRAPYLSTSRAMFETLGEFGFRYDASGVSRDPADPHVEDALYRFSLPMIPEGPARRRIIAMDYNLFVRHSGGLDRPADAEEFAQRTYHALLGAFEMELAGKRRPLQIGFHFTLMNGGAYWDALERFAGEVCPRADVRCVSHRDFLLALDDDTLGG